MSGTPLARPDAWRLWWSFTWRQALIFVAGNAALWAVYFALKRLGVPPQKLIATHPYLTLALIAYSGYEAFRRLLIVYDIRFPGGPSDEQNHRHRR
ncbi:MAG: hypothetical protein COV48_09120 [Elusimicrobia bacterium CG11_big_fil_rev_8_21_14_0_20_64_6]|nr:MAG: hypothetical protein COV48_09120 [Elusimicrobia bacterium CG11_big_fil_rev_8_21_14_0_20_64_6]